jgi:hypothetical protein
MFNVLKSFQYYKMHGWYMTMTKTKRSDPEFKSLNDKHIHNTHSALGYGLDDRGSGVRFSAGDGYFSIYHRCVKNGSGAHQASYPVGTRVSFPWGKAAGAWSRSFTSI